MQLTGRDGIRIDDGQDGRMLIKPSQYLRSELLYDVGDLQPVEELP